MFGIEVKIWDNRAQKYVWEFARPSTSHQSYQFKTMKEAEDFAVGRYSKILKPDMVRVARVP
jgi:hypothetical protein